MILTGSWLIVWPAKLIRGTVIVWGVELMLWLFNQKLLLFRIHCEVRIASRNKEKFKIHLLISAKHQSVRMFATSKVEAIDNVP